MPCYCDTPNDQEEIHRRAKERMYFDAAGFVEAKFPVKYTIDIHLCELCKKITIEQMKLISAYYYGIDWPYKTLYDWYVDHLHNDIKHNSNDDEIKVAQSELKRLKEND